MAVPKARAMFAETWEVRRWSCRRAPRPVRRGAPAADRPLLSRLDRRRPRPDQALQADLGRGGHRVRRAARVVRDQLQRQPGADAARHAPVRRRPRGSWTTATRSSSSACRNTTSTAGTRGPWISVSDPAFDLLDRARPPHPARAAGASGALGRARGHRADLGAVRGAGGKLATAPGTDQHTLAGALSIDTSTLAEVCLRLASRGRI